VEDFIDGSYTKFNNIFGGVESVDSTLFPAAAAAFSHFRSLPPSHASKSTHEHGRRMHIIPLEKGWMVHIPVIVLFMLFFPVV